MNIARIYSSSGCLNRGYFLKGKARGSLSSLPPSWVEWTSEGLRRIFTFELGRAVWIASQLKSQRSASPLLFHSWWSAWPACVTAPRTSVQTLGQGVRIRKFLPDSPAPRHPHGQKKHVPSRPRAKRGSLWTWNFMGKGIKQGLPEIEDMRYLIPWMVWFELWRVKVGRMLKERGQLSFWFWSCSWLLYVSTSAGVIQVFGPKLCARPGFPEKSQTDNSAYLRGALSLVEFIAICDFIRLCRKIIAQIHKYFRGMWVCNERSEWKLEWNQGWIGVCQEGA